MAFMPTSSVKPHTLNNAKSHNAVTDIQHTAHTMTQLTACVDRTTPPPHNHKPFTHNSPSSSPTVPKIPLVSSTTLTARASSGGFGNVSGSGTKVTHSRGHVHPKLRDIHRDSEESTLPECHHMPNLIQ